MVELSALQCRVIGVMLEKEITTPDQYPLSLNALTNACNQKSNREPVLSLSETDVQNIVDELIQLNQLSIQSGASRVSKYQHRFCNTPFGDLQLAPQQRAIICLLLLRGPQTPGELRTRSNRLADFNDVSEVELALQQLHDLNGATLVQKLAREPGKRESRYAQLFAPLEFSTDSENIRTKDVITQENEQNLQDRVTQLEVRISELTQQLTAISHLLEEK